MCVILHLNVKSTEVLLTELENSSIVVNRNGTTRFSLKDNLMERSDLFQPEIRIYFLNMYPKHARRILCMVREPAI